MWIARIIGGVAALVACLSLVPSSLAAPALDGEFDLSDMPKHLTQGPDGNIWVAFGSKVARITPAGAVTEYDPQKVGSPHGIAAGPDGNLWVTQAGGVARFSPQNPDAAEEFAIAEISSGEAIVTGPDGNLWTASGKNVIEIPPGNPAGRELHEVAGMDARGIDATSDALWVVDRTGGRMIRMATDGTFDPITVGGGPQEVAAGPSNVVAFTNPSGDHHVGRLVAGGSPLTTLTGTTDPFGIDYGPDGAWWFAEFGTKTIGRLTADGQVTHLDGFSSGPRHITAGPGNTLWVALEQANKVARVSGVVAPPASGGPGGGTGSPGTGSADRVAPAVRRLSLAHRKLRAGKRPVVRLTLSEAGRVRIELRRRGARRASVVTRRAKAGRNVLRLRRLRPGRYVLKLTVTDAAGNRSAPKRLTLRVVKR
jgi:virginiamycin B lyase